MTFLGVIIDKFGAGPALVIVPNSTITNWIREFQRWTPHLRVVPFYGEVKARSIIKQYELYHGQDRRGDLVIKYDVLLGLAALNDLMRSGAKLVLDLLQDRNHEWGHDGEHPNRHLLLELLENLGQNGDLINHLADALQNLIVELDRRHDLLEDILDVTGELFGVTGGDLGVLHLRVVGVVTGEENATLDVLIAPESSRSSVAFLASNSASILIGLNGQMPALLKDEVIVVDLNA